MENLIELLKKNRYPFGMWTDLECYGPELGKKMQEKTKELAPKRVLEFWCFTVWTMAATPQWKGDITYRLRSDYTEEPEIEECEIHKTDDGSLGYRRKYNGGCGGSNLVFRAFADPDFIGFKFEDGTVFGLPVKYSVPGMTSHGYYASYEDLKTKQAFEHHVTHTLFRRQK